MNYLFDIGHPAHVHLYRHSIKNLLSAGHNVSVTVKNIPEAQKLLENYNIEHRIINDKRDSILGKGILQISNDLKTIILAKRQKIDIGIGSSITIAHASRLVKMKSILLDDDDDDVQPLFVKYAHPFCNTLLSPEAVRHNRKRSGTIFYNSLHELAYLHPELFEPDPSILGEIGIDEKDKYFVLRFNVFKAHHDRNVSGFNLQQKLELVSELGKFGKVLITTERSIEKELQDYQIRIAPEKIHSLLYYATMFIGDSQTMTSEAAVLGTPAIRCNTLVGRISYLNELEHRYGLTYGFLPRDFNRLIDKVKSLLKNKDLKIRWADRRNTLLADKINTTRFLTWFIENYPESTEIMQKNPDHQYHL